MSTTRRFYLSNEGFEEEMALGEANGYCTIVDPDNLPPEAIQRAAEVVCGSEDHYGDLGYPCHDHLEVAEAAITAFLSDPEPGDQT